MDRREIMKRTLEVNAYWGIGNATCHDVEVASTRPDVVPDPEDEGYIVSLDLQTGALSTSPLEAE